MNRTLLLFGAAGALALVALFVSPRSSIHFPPPPPPPAGNGALTLEARFSHPAIAPGMTDAFLTLDIRGKDVPGSQRRPVQVALLLDRSGSMQGEKIQNAKAAARALITKLGPEDALSLIHYGSDVVVLPARPMTPANREAILAAVDRIEDEGGTNISGALTEAGKVFSALSPSGAAKRIILVSDGQPTEGETDPRAITAMVRSLRQQGLSISSIGVGADFNEDLMQAVAELGAGSYGYLRDTNQLASLFTQDLEQASTLVAKNVEISVQLPPGVALKEALGYRAVQEGSRVRIPLPDFAARQSERVVVSVSVQAPTSGTKMAIAQVDLAYEDLLKKGPALAQTDLHAEVTDRFAEVEARQDKDVAVASARAQSAQNILRATEALRAGNKEQAQKLLLQNAPLFERAGSIAGPGAVAADMKAQDELSRDLNDGAASGEELEHRIKGAKRKAWIDLGKTGSVH